MIRTPYYVYTKCLGGVLYIASGKGSGERHNIPRNVDDVVTVPQLDFVESNDTHDVVDDGDAHLFGPRETLELVGNIPGVVRGEHLGSVFCCPCCNAPTAGAKKQKKKTDEEGRNLSMRQT